MIGDVTEESWRARARCDKPWFGIPLFFGDHVCSKECDTHGCSEAVGAPFRSDRIAEAKAECFRCPVRAECAESAINDAEQMGVMGGLTYGERRRIRQARAARARAAGTDQVADHG